jgi:hypothetical protein
MGDALYCILPGDTQSLVVPFLVMLSLSSGATRYQLDPFIVGFLLAFDLMLFSY